MADKLTEWFGGPLDGKRDWLNCLKSQTRQGVTVDGEPAFFTYVRSGDRMVFLGWLEWGEPAIRAACHQQGVSTGP